MALQAAWLSKEHCCPRSLAAQALARPRFQARLNHMSFQWYALHVKPHKEPLVYQLMQTLDFEVYYPVLKVTPVNPRSRKERPFFPGYMFVSVDLDKTGADALRWTEGTYGLVQFGGEPRSVPDSLVVELKDQLDKYMATMESAKSNFKRGDQVRIVNGLFEGYDAIFDTHISGKDRVQVLLAYLNDQPKKVVLDSAVIAKAKRSTWNIGSGYRRRK